VKRFFTWVWDLVLSFISFITVTECDECKKVPVPRFDKQFVRAYSLNQEPVCEDCYHKIWDKHREEEERAKLNEEVKRQQRILKAKKIAHRMESGQDPYRNE
jgi:hypothetical protein